MELPPGGGRRGAAAMSPRGQESAENKIVVRAIGQCELLASFSS